MSNKQIRLSDRAEASVLEQIVVRLIEPHQQERWDQLVREHHYVNQSCGFKRVAQDFYEAHDRPKRLYAREIVKHAARQLRRRHLPEALREHEQKIDRSCPMPGDELLSFWQTIHRQVPESRNVHGMRHKQATVLTITFAYLLSGSQGTHWVGAINARSGRALGVEALADKSNEIPAGQTLLDRLELDGAIALMDALHTQTQTARAVVQERGGDYVLFVKGNQPGLLRQARHFLPEDFSPSAPAG